MPDELIQRGQDEVHRIVEELNLPVETGDVACEILMRAGENDLFSGRAIELTAGATVVIACRQAGLPYSSRDIAPLSSAPSSDEQADSPSIITETERVRRKLEASLDIETGVVKPNAYINRFVSELELTPRTEEVARDILSQASGADRGSLSGKSSAGVAGAAIYLATLLCDERRTQSEIADVTSSEGAIRTNYHTLLTVFHQHNIRFEEEDLDTERFDHEINKVTTGNANDADEEVGSTNETKKHDETIETVV